MTALWSIKIFDPLLEEVPASLAFEEELGNNPIKLDIYKSYDLLIPL